MDLADIDYDLPESAVGQVPAEPRDSARLLLDRGVRSPGHARVRDLPRELREGDLLVLNETKVLPARLELARTSGGQVEVLLLEPLDRSRRTWTALVRPGRKMRTGEELWSDDRPVVVVEGRGDVEGTFRVTVLGDDPDVTIRSTGSLPLPPYITSRPADDSRYQTVYAASEGSAAAPTAGLHFTHRLLREIADAGVTIAHVDLVVGIDTFKPVTVADPTRHPIHTESYRVPEQVMESCRTASRVVAVGTTVTRALETAAATGNLCGRSDLLISRGHQWRIVDLLMTNFHMPRTSLLLLVDAFVGPRWRALYESALAEGYRFLSFGDAMLLDRRAESTAAVVL